jgi:hypothetical protein
MLIDLTLSYKNLILIQVQIPSLGTDTNKLDILKDNYKLQFNNKLRLIKKKKM